MNIDDVMKAANRAKDIADVSLLMGEAWEANTPDGLIPNSWVDDNGVRHAVIKEAGMPDRCRLRKINGEWKLIDIGVF